MSVCRIYSYSSSSSSLFLLADTNAITVIPKIPPPIKISRPIIRFIVDAVVPHVSLMKVVKNKVWETYRFILRLGLRITFSMDKTIAPHQSVYSSSLGMNIYHSVGAIVIIFMLKIKVAKFNLRR